MKHIKYFIFAVTVSIFVSCDTEEFLNPLPDTAVAVDGFFQSDADVLAGIIGIYDALFFVYQSTGSNGIYIFIGHYSFRESTRLIDSKIVFL